MRLTLFTSAAFGSSLLLLASCGEDTNMDDCDPSKLSHGESLPAHCNADKTAFDLESEGGEVRVWIYRNKAADVRSVSMQALFFKDQNPAKRPLLSPVLVEGTTECYDMRPVSAAGVYDAGKTTRFQEIADSRTYVDVGSKVTVAAGGHSFDLEKKIDTEEVFNAIKHDIVYQANVSSPYATNTTNVATGSDLNVTGPALTNGVDIVHLAAAPSTPAIWMPDDFDVTSHDLAHDLVLPVNQDAHFTYTGADPDELYSLTFFDLATITAPVVCIGPATGMVTVPKKALELVKSYAPTGEFVLGKFLHRAYDQEGRRIDLLGLNCQAGSYTIE